MRDLALLTGMHRRGAIGILLSMTLAGILSSIDSEIARLTQARALLSDLSTKDSAALLPKRRKLSAAARKRIGEAQRKRWAKQKKGK